MKKMFITVLALLIAFVFSGCSSAGTAGTHGAESFVSENKTIYSDNAVVEYNGLVYFSNFEKIYSFDGKTCKEEMSGAKGAPLYFYIDGKKLLYITEYQSTVFSRNMSDLANSSSTEKAFGRLYMDWMQQYGYEKDPTLAYDLFHHNTFLAAEGHVFYKGRDKKLHRTTADGANDQAISKIDVERLTYSHGYVYFTDQWDSNGRANLYRIRTDGTEQKKLTDRPVDSYYISQTGSLYCIISNQDTEAYSICKVDPDSLNMVLIKQDYCPSGIIGIDDDSIYITGGIEFERMPLDGGAPETIYNPVPNSVDTFGFPPVLVGDYIYFCLDHRFYRIKKDGTDLADIGIEFAYLNPRV